MLRNEDEIRALLEEDDDTSSETSDHVEFDESSYETDDDELPLPLPQVFEPVLSYLSKDKNIQWFPEPFSRSGRASSSNVIHLTPGITRYAATRINDEISAFQLLSIEQIIIDNTNLEGQRIYQENWKP